MQQARFTPSINVCNDACNVKVASSVSSGYLMNLPGRVIGLLNLTEGSMEDPEKVFPVP